MKILDGKELADFIKERQAKQVRALRQSQNVQPRLAIVQTIDSPVIDAYVRLKKAYGTDILIDVDIYKINQSAIRGTINTLNNNPSVHGIIVQLPLDNPGETDTVVNLVSPEKDVDGLGEHAILTPATAMAIDWLVAGYNIDLASKTIAIVGKGRLVGAPLLSLWQGAGYNVSAYDRQTVDLSKVLRLADVIVTATGVPGLISSNMIAPGAVVIDAGTAAEHGKIIGDLASDVRLRDDLTITPEKGGVGPLTVSALFDNVIRAAQGLSRN